MNEKKQVICWATPTGKNDFILDKSVIYENKFEDNLHGIYWYKSEKEKILLTNFIFTFMNEWEEIYQDGSSRVVLKIQIKYYDTFSEKEEFYYLDILKNDIQSLLSLICRSYPFLCIFNMSPRIINLLNEYRSMIYSRCRNINDFYYQKYMYPGWENVNGTFRYLSNNSIFCTCNRTLAPMDYNYNSICNIATSILSLAEPAVIIPLFLQMHLGILFNLFDLAGCKIQHILTLTGPTGSRKTSLSLELFCNFEVQNIAGLETSTSSGLEGKAQECRDLSLVIDDLWKSNSENQKNKLEFFMRQYCDNSERVKRDINSPEKIIKSTLRCGAILTAESIPEDYQKSSLLRLLVVPIKQNSVNNDVLYQFQQNRILAYNTPNTFSWIDIYLSYFIDFLVKNHSNIIQFIRDYSNIDYCTGEYRLDRIYKILLITHSIIFRFFSEYKSECPLSRDCVEQILKELIQFNYNLANRTPIHEKMLKVLCEGIRNGNLSIADSRNTFINSYPIKKYIGFYEINELFIEPNLAYEYIASKLGITSIPGKTEFLILLRNNNFSSGYETKGHAPRLLKRIKVLDKYIDILSLKISKLNL